ncbi:helix-turn-helix domain-containing protein [Glaciibacter psychrotolerans]
MLAALQESAQPLDAASVAARIELHVTTTRFHLNRLEDAGLVRRAAPRAGTRGRPRVLYTSDPSVRSVEAHRDLVAVLSSSLGEDDDGGRARAIRAGESWSQKYEQELNHATGPGVDALVGLLDRLGYDAVSDSHLITLRACPFREEALRNPDVVCGVHLGLLRGAAEVLGQENHTVSLRPFTGPGRCEIELSAEWFPQGEGFSRPD